ncbi:MAG: hypothetical protein ACOY94_02225 [Bacillota bacterium]
MAEKERTRLVEQRATNSQTVAFVADQEAAIADQAEGLAKEHPELGEFASRERANRDRLQAVVEEERRLATAIQFEFSDELTLAAQAREHRMELLEVAREEGRIAEGLLAREAEDPTVEVLAEQARRNRTLLLHVASTEREADQALREAEGEPEAPGTCVTGSGLASGLSIGAAMAMVEAAQGFVPPDEQVTDGPPQG